MKYGYIRVSCADKQEYLRQENILKDYNIDKLFEETFGNQKKYIDMLHKETGELLVNLLAEKDKQIAELKKQLEEKEKEIRQLDNEKGMLLNNSMKLLKEKDDRLKAQPAEIVGKIGGEIYTRMVVECKETKYTDINLILNTILKDYEEK